MTEPESPRGVEAAGAAELRLVAGGEEPHSLVELINRVLDRGVVVGGDVTLSVAGVDLVYLGLNALLTSVSTARRTLGRRALGTGRPPPVSPAGAERAGGGAAARLAAAAEGRAPATPAAEAVSGVLAAELVQVAEHLPERIDVDPDAVQRDLARLVLTLVELVRQVVEHQAVRRMEDPDLSEAQVERMGLALRRLEEKMREIKAVFGLADEELNVDLGPLGKLLE